MAVMKTFKIFLLSIFGATLIEVAFSAEVKTLVASNAPVEISVNPNDVIEFLNCRITGSGVSPLLTLSFEGYTFQTSGTDFTGTYTGLNRISVMNNGSMAGGILLTLKITSASEINAAGPTSVLVLPENAEGNYDLTVEASSDMVTWTPIHSQAVQSNTASRMFRVRIAKK